MTTTNKTVLGIVLAVVVLFVGAYAIRMHSLNDVPENSDSGLSTNPSDTSDAALVKDSAALDAQMTAVDQDSTAVNQGIVTHTQAQ